MDISRPFFLRDGITCLDHVALPYPVASGEEAIRAFWESLGMKVTARDETAWIDHAGPGRRLDVGTVTHTHVVYYPSRLSFARRVARAILGTLFTRDKTLGHVAFTVSPTAFRSLMDHPAFDGRQGRNRNGLIRWGTTDASLFLRGPFDLRVEFHCANAPADLLSQLG